MEKDTWLYVKMLRKKVCHKIKKCSLLIYIDIKKILKLGIFILFFRTESQKNCDSICVNYYTRKHNKRNYKT